MSYSIILDSKAGRPRPPRIRALVGAAAVAGLLAGPGCGGRTSSGQQAPDLGSPRHDANVRTDGVAPPDIPLRRDSPDDFPYPRFDLPRPVDLGWPDWPVAPEWGPPPPPPDHGVPCASRLGARCTADADCCAGRSCVPLSTGISVCTISCTPDDPMTPLVNEDSCPAGNLCGSTDPQVGSPVCLPKCAPARGKNDCPAGVACNPVSVSLSGWLDQAVCAHAACTMAEDCPVRLAQPCVVGSSQACAGMPPTAYCAPIQPGSGSGQCAIAGVCDATSGLCMPHSQGSAAARVGSPCTDDRDCGSAMICDMERIAGGTVAHARNGYCTIVGCTFDSSLPSRACPQGSTCNRLHPGGRCFKVCDLTQGAQCRGHAQDRYGDYDCYGWDKLASGGIQISQQPTCEPADTYPCSIFSGAGGLTCSILGLQGNPTKMRCRDQATGQGLPDHSPSGLCLDNTGSDTLPSPTP